jgi:hypothetical protein
LVDLHPVAAAIVIATNGRDKPGHYRECEALLQFAVVVPSG